MLCIMVKDQGNVSAGSLVKTEQNTCTFDLYHLRNQHWFVFCLLGVREGFLCFVLLQPEMFLLDIKSKGT